MHAPYNM